MKLRTALKIMASLSAVLMVSCGPVPRRVLTDFEKKADLYWLYSKFDQYYAPTQYKEELLKFEYEKLKNEILEKAAKAETNEEYYAVVREFVNTFEDAHTSVSFQMSGLPKRANIAYLGFSGTRSGDNLVVTKRLPTVAASFDYPILEGDVITKIDGKPLKEYVDENLLKTRHLGQTESNYTYHLNRIFTRTSIYQPMPEGENPVATITIDRGGIEEDVVLPWIVKDVYTFEQEQARAQTNSNPFMDTDSKPNGDAVDGLAKFASKYFRVGHNMANTEVLKKYLKLAVDFGLSEKPADLNKVLVERNKLRWETMMVVNNDMTWDIAEAKPTSEALQADPLIGLRQERYVESGPNIIPIKGSFLMPAYVKIAKTKTGERKAVGYIRIESFSLPANADAELRTTLSAMNTIGQTFTDKNVEDIVLDLIDNGGGSLVAGLRLAQALSAEKIEMPAMQFGLNETWLDEYHAASISEGVPDVERELYRRTYEKLAQEADDGKKISSPMPMSSFLLWDIKPNASLEGRSLNVRVLVNEMCASMCDIFTAILQDNKVAKVMGTRSMGAGGNVTQHFSSPNSQMQISQTESLIVRSNGQYVENVGVTPDEELDTSDRPSKYTSVINAAMQDLLKEKAADESTEIEVEEVTEI